MNAGRRVFGTGLFLTCAFPYVTVVATPFDTQPYAIVAAALTLVAVLAARGDVRVPHVLLPFGIVLALAVAALLARSDPAAGFRSMVGYASVFVIGLAAYHAFPEVTGRHLIAVVAVWTLVGTVQMTVDKTFGAFLLPRLSTSAARGVTSLAVEPSYYAVVCVCLLILADVLYARHRLTRRQYAVVFALTLVQILYARAGLGVLMFLVYLAARLVSQVRFTKLLKGAVALAAFVCVFLTVFRHVPVLATSRVGRQLTLATTDPWKLLLSDGSVSDRLVHVLVSHGSVLDRPLGFGPGTWGHGARDLAADMGGLAYELATVNMSTGTNRVMSGWGSVFFELGIAGLLFLGGFVAVMVAGWRRADARLRPVYVSSAITVYVLMLMAVPIAFPLFGYLLGVFTRLRDDATVAVTTASPARPAAPAAAARRPRPACATTRAPAPAAPASTP